MENNTENNTEQSTVNNKLLEEYNAEYPILVENLKKLIKETPLCYFLQRTGEKVTVISVKNCLTVNEVSEIQKNEETGESIVATRYNGAFTPKNSTLSINLAVEDAKALWEAIKEKEKSFSREQIIEEQNRIVISLLKEANESFANNSF